MRRLVAHLGPLENTSQYRWLIEICKKFFGFQGDRIDSSNWESLYDTAERSMASAQWSQTVLEQSNVEAVFLTNEFDDDLSGFDTGTYIPCLRTDDLVFKLQQRDVQQRLEQASGVSLNGSLDSLRRAIRQRFEYFTTHGARACAISLPPSFEPTMVNEGRASNALGAVLRHGEAVEPSHVAALSRAVFWMLAELCDEFRLPFDLMIGVNRGVYAEGVFQGQDLYDSRVSLIQYRELFNAFPDVKFPVSVLASVTNQELVSYAWIFPNVITNGHWWYSNTPSFIHRDASARLEAVPQTKQIAYYSDAYKLEFVWPKFDMYRNVLANILADHFVGFNGWSETQAIELGYKVLRGNVEAIFPSRAAEPLDAAAAEESGRAETESLGTIASGTASLAAAATATADPIEQEETTQDELETVAFQDAADPPTEHPDAGELDPLPSEEELKAIDVPDVELRDRAEQRELGDAAAIQSELDPEPLELGELLGEEDESTTEEAAELEALVLDDGSWDADADKPTIELLRGEESFSPDEDSLRVQPDPLTGELTFPAAQSEPLEDDDFDASAIGFVETESENPIPFEPPPEGLSLEGAAPEELTLEEEFTLEEAPSEETPREFEEPVENSSEEPTQEPDEPLR
ncbi:MAG: glucuronate isomerase [Novipirellula sp. JB048]